MLKEELINILKKIWKDDKYIKENIDMYMYFLKQDIKLNKIWNPEWKSKDEVFIEYISLNLSYFKKIYTRNSDTKNYIPDTWTIQNDLFWVNNIRKNRDSIFEKMKPNILKELKSDINHQKEAKNHKHWEDHYYWIALSNYIVESWIIDSDTNLIRKNKFI